MWRAEVGNEGEQFKGNVSWHAALVDTSGHSFRFWRAWLGGAGGAEDPKGGAGSQAACPTSPAPAGARLIFASLAVSGSARSSQHLPITMALPVYKAAVIGTSRMGAFIE